MALDSHLYGDPMIILERKQQARIRKDEQCGACIFKSIFKGEPYCAKSRQTYGHRCFNYQTRDKK